MKSEKGMERKTKKWRRRVHESVCERESEGGGERVKEGD